MAAIGGSVESITIAGREFAVTADADTNRKLGGFENEIGMNGNGTGRILKTPVASGLTGMVVQCDDTRGDHEYLEGIKNGNDFVPVAVTYASSETYQGTAIITGELQYSSQASTCAFDMQGAGTFTKQ
jgi:hypothetical protein